MEQQQHPLEEIEQKKLRRLEICQLITFLLTIVAFADVHLRLARLEEDCTRTRADESGSGSFRYRRGAVAAPPAYPLNTSRSDVWVHSLSKIKVNELLTKCLEIHQYCTDAASTERGPPGPIGPPGPPGYTKFPFYCSSLISSLRL
ncbi:unnamed protein product [Toxocara canis]|uniref:Uncharacterized protein n=1 Tax=Toxocara canis TaxID=6265 RepID=A0A183UYA9_TOXCA|nr:unnamed protein product [Toxocara canis]